MGVVTVSRLYGAGGIRVASAVAMGLGYRLVDREIVELAAREAGVDPDVARRLDERAPGLIEKVGLALASASSEFGLGHPPPLHDRALADGVRRVLRSLAEAGGYVMLGRGGQAALRDRTDAVHVQLVADLEDRARRAAGWQGIPLDEARERCRQVDGERATYVRRFYDTDIMNPTLYHAVLNTSRLGLDRATQIVVSIARAVEAEP